LEIHCIEQTWLFNVVIMGAWPEAQLDRASLPRVTPPTQFSKLLMRVSSADHDGSRLMARDVEYLKHLLELEYEHSRSAIDKFDNYRATLKGWLITASAGIAAVAFSAHNSSVFWAGGLMVALFGSAELLYIDIQEDAITRNRELEIFWTL
jgi:hypothetical protein